LGLGTGLTPGAVLSGNTFELLERRNGSMRRLKISLVLVALFVGGGATYVWAHWQSCSTLRECYWSWKAFTSNEGPMEGRRSRVMSPGFTASANLIAIQAPTSAATDGLVLVDRAGKRTAIIAQDGFTYWAPRFSDDGERLIFVRAQAGRAQQELLSCVVDNWHCTILLSTTDTIVSPVDVGDGKVLFALGYPIVHGDKEVPRHRTYDFHIVSPGHPPVRMTEYRFVALHAISVGNRTVYFSAEGSRVEDQTASCVNVIKCNRSKIFRLDFDRDADRILNAPDKLAPAIKVDGLSVQPRISADGARLAFLNTSFDQFTYRYNLKVSDPVGDAPQTIEVDGISFSAGAFVGDTLLVNELFKDRYRVSAFDRDLNPAGTTEINHSTGFLNQLHHIDLTID
jgi:WD40 repeat protein